MASKVVLTCCSGSQQFSSLHAAFDAHVPCVCPGLKSMASSSRSQVAARSASTAAHVACGRPSVCVRWRPPLSVAIVIHFVTQSLAGAGRREHFSTRPQLARLDGTWAGMLTKPVLAVPALARHTAQRPGGVADGPTTRFQGGIARSSRDVRASCAVADCGAATLGAADPCQARATFAASTWCYCRVGS